ncbi:MAG: NADH:flavin oxidoreductase [Paludisphaera borealis]|uniref:oxidoreductase n=1 Tax=Paludisphaera borealis TaxID=1387353 RepID=UPI002846B696|nr:NADH:flavin oxidoreductase [Paludisphaera borealis]MDR3622562.1 NADH:flavin oxidoreductase [Paludisphaera borealis]
MSRYFKYKKSVQLADDASRLGLAVGLRPDLSPLLEPFGVDGRKVGNRLAVQPMEGCDAEPDGKPGPLTIRRFERFGGGGAKLIWGEACAVVPEGRANPRQLLINDANAASLGAIVQTCREAHRQECGDDADLIVGLQLTHSGRYSFARPILAQHDPLLDPRTVVDKATGTKAGPDSPLISDDELLRLQDAFVAAADLAYRLGFDFVDLKQCHRYLLNELLSARTRPGRFGGSFENRTRFVREVTGRIREAHPGKIIATRMNVFDGAPYQIGPDGAGEPCPFTSPVQSTWGTRADDPREPDLDEPIALIGLLRKLGVGLVNVTLGNPYASPHLLRPFEYPPPDGYETPEHPLIGVDRHFRLTAQIQSAFPDLAVVGSGYSWLQAFAFEAGAANVAAGRATFMGVGRGSLSQPDFGVRVARGEPLDPKRLCRTFSYCTALMRSKHNELGQFATGCPPFDKAVYGPIWDEAKTPSSQDFDRK